MGVHFHPANHLLCAIVGPGDGRIGVESAEAWPSLAQADEQVSQLVERSELVSTFSRISFDIQSYRLPIDRSLFGGRHF